MINVCTNCHAVSFGRNGWRYINKYNHGRLCVICNHGIKRYEYDIPDAWLEEQKQLHERWKAQSA